MKEKAHCRNYSKHRDSLDVFFNDFNMDLQIPLKQMNLLEHERAAGESRVCPEHSRISFTLFCIFTWIYTKEASKTMNNIIFGFSSQHVSCAS